MDIRHEMGDGVCPRRLIQHDQKFLRVTHPIEECRHLHGLFINVSTLIKFFCIRTKGRNFEFYNISLSESRIVYLSFKGL